MNSRRWRQNEFQEHQTSGITVPSDFLRLLQSTRFIGAAVYLTIVIERKWNMMKTFSFLGVYIDTRGLVHKRRLAIKIPCRQTLLFIYGTVNRCIGPTRNTEGGNDTWARVCVCVLKYWILGLWLCGIRRTPKKGIWMQWLLSSSSSSSYIHFHVENNYNGADNHIFINNKRCERRCGERHNANRRILPRRHFVR